MLDSVRSDHHATFLGACQEQQLMPTGFKIHKPPAVMSLDDTFRKQHNEILQKAERELLDLALEHVNALNKQYDDDIIDIINELDTQLSDREHKKFNDKADSLQQKLKKRRSWKLNSLQKNKNNPTNNKKSANIKTNDKTNTNSTKKQTNTRSTAVKSTSAGTFPRSGKNTSNKSKKTSYNNNNNPTRNPQPNVEKRTIPSQIT